jgi:alpha-galactosidase
MGRIAGGSSLLPIVGTSRGQTTLKVNMGDRTLRNSSFAVILAVIFSNSVFGQSRQASRTPSETLKGNTIAVSVNSKDGSYTIFDGTSGKAVLHSGVAAEVDHQWIKSSEYPHHGVTRENVSDSIGLAEQVTVSNTGLAGKPDLIYSLQLHTNPEFAKITIKLHNSGTQAVAVEALRAVDAGGKQVIDLGGPDASDRVMSDSFSEDRPAMTIHDLADATDGMHRAVGSQLIYNRDSKRDLFLGTLSSEKFLTILRLHVDKDHISSYEVDSTGTTELEKENSLQLSPSEDQIALSLPVAPDSDLSSEPLLISTGNDYHRQLENYGSIIRGLHHARVNAPSIAGWWSWTAFYFGLNQGTALTNAQWLSQNLKDLGYRFFHIDEGYQYARGEYTTPDAALFPGGMKRLETKVRGLGLSPGIWTAPFEVSERSWVYENHKDWLVHNAAGQPIHAGYVIAEEKLDPLYILDCTNPAAQDYLRQTYRTLAHDWGIRYIKMDFMDDSAIEGFYYRPNTTAMEAQRMGLQVIREAVGDDILLDKDGSVMLNPVGFVDFGRISQDTGHTFESSRDAATGIAARYYMNRNFFVADPDAFTVSGQTVDEQEWHGGKHPLTLDEARISIALAAVSGGMYEIGDDLPKLGMNAERMALVKNEDLRNMSRLGKSSSPLDLMSYAPDDGQPSTFLLQESKRTAMLTVFNWTDHPRQRSIDLAPDLGLQLEGHNQVLDVLDSTAVTQNNVDKLALQLPPHSVRVLKIIDSSIPAAAPGMTVHVPETAQAGEAVSFSAEADPDGVPVVTYLWEFGDGTHSEQAHPVHFYTHAGEFSVRLVATGLDGLSFDKTMAVKVDGKIETRFYPTKKQRLSQAP